MTHTNARALTVAMCALLTACGSETSPSGPAIAGQWSGTTSQGSPIAFSVSSDERVTTITVGHNFNGCSGSQTFSSLSVDTVPQVTCIPGPCAPSLQSYRSFLYSNGQFEGPMTTVRALFVAPGRAEGQVEFRGFECGTSLATWVATRR